jgi:hypothetical protein
MPSVGVRGLQQRARALLRRGAAAGGRPRERSRTAGEVARPTADLDDLPAPLALDAGREPPALVLARLRRDER